MKKLSIFFLLATFLLAFTMLSANGVAQTQAQTQTQTQTQTRKPVARTFQVDHGEFLLNGKPFRIISGEVHYPRIPRAQWRQTFRMARAMGLNTITTYVFWNVHEPVQGVYNFAGNADVAEFIREAQQEGLYVILRPGPYVCAEWELGGFPAWMMKTPNMPLRTDDPRYMVPVKKWLRRLGKELAPLQYENGGPILLVQVENEYGSYGHDKKYIADMRQTLIDSGFNKSVLYTADGPEQTPNDALPDMPAGFNFGPGKTLAGVTSRMAFYKKLRPQGPYIVSEYWDGWFEHWGSPWDHTNGPEQAKEIEYILQHDSSISLYMFRGGTSFGWMNGANSSGPKSYQPDVTSYDYDAPVNEAGQPTPKFYEIRAAIEHATGVVPPPLPKIPALRTLPPIPFHESASLWQNLPKPLHSVHPISMEDAGQAYGYILYRTTLKQPLNGTLDLGVMHQYAQVYVDGKLEGTADRRLQQNTVTITNARAGSRLDILVENTGRINFGKQILGERIGLLTNVSAYGSVLTGWDIYPLPMQNLQRLHFRDQACTGPCFYRSAVSINKPGSTYLDTHELHKGQLWMNGHNLGRFWNIGPQGALYLPASWMKAGKNNVVFFDLEAAPHRSIVGLDHAITDLGSATAAQ